MATEIHVALVSVMGAAVFALAIAASAFAQAPPALPHQFYGVGGSAMLDGAPAADGAVVTATNQDGEAVGSATISGDGWFIDVESGDATSVTFSIDGSTPSDAYDVTAGGARRGQPQPDLPGP